MTLTGLILFTLNDIRELKQLRDESAGMRRNVACADLAVKEKELADLEAVLDASRAILGADRRVA